MKANFILIQTLFLIAIAPMVSGLIRKIKNNLRMRKGPGIFQPYYNLRKLFAKDEVISGNSSWIFRVTPFIVFGSILTASLLVPVLTPAISFSLMGDFLVIIFLFALGRFFMTLAGLDAGSAFCGMGSSREMFISSMAEPAALLSVFAVSANCASTNLSEISALSAMHFSSIVAAFALLLVLIAETSRIPVDNQETHLELTMVHEAMVLEYSGRSLALIELASHIKQIIFFSLIANVVFPLGITFTGTGFAMLLAGIIIYLFKLAVISAVISIIEVSVAKMRLFRVVDFLNFAFVLSLVAVVTAVIGL